MASILDADLLPQEGQQIEGETTHVVINGWTVISFWDRTVDSRGNSNSAFVIYGKFSFSEAVEISKQAFPEIWNRFTFTLVER